MASSRASVRFRVSPALVSALLAPSDDYLAQTMAVQMLRGHYTGINTALPAAAALPVSKFARVLDHIEAALDGELSLDALAEIGGMNPLYFARAFRKQFGESPHRFVLRRRIERGKRLLTETDTPLAEIALACGFASQSHFAATFRRQVGVTPGEYRKG